MNPMRQYIALIHKDADSDYGVSFPDFPGCISAGKTLDEARNMASEALAFHVAGMIEDGEAIAEPSTLEAVMADQDNRDGVAILVPLEAQSKTVRVNISVPSEVLDLIDRHAEANGFTRSGFIVSAARQAMGGAG
jgi:predicted RNase H-like HicB family nuclease